MKKRLFVILLSLVLMVGLSVAALAAGEDTSGTVAKIGSTEYSTLAAAVADVPTDGTETTITLTANVTGITTDGIITIAEGQNIVLDLSGFSITVDGTANAFEGRPIINNGTLTVTGNGTISSEASELGGYGAILNNEGAALTIENGTFAGNVMANGSAVRNLGDCIINDGDFTGTAAVYNASTGNLTINDGNFHTTSCNRTTNSEGVACWSYCVSSDGNLVFNNGTVTGVQGALAIAGGTGVVYDGEFTTVACEHDANGATAFYAIYIAGETGNATASIYGGTFTAASKAAIMVGNDNKGGDGGINAPASVTIYDGEFNSQENVNVMLTGPSTGSPKIEGGIFSNDTVGRQGAESEKIESYLPEGVTISQDENGKQTVQVNTASAVAEANGKPYLTVQAAIDSIYGSGEVKLLRGVQEDIVIAEGDITLNLNGCTLTNVTSDTITVRIGAVLTVTGTGTVDNKSNGKAAVFNEGTVVLEGGTYDRTSETGESADVSGGNSWYTICNHGTMTIGEGVTVKNTGSFSSMIENGYYSYTDANSRNGHVEGVNAANPLLTINGGSFIGGLNSVKNDDGGILEINGGSYTNTTQAAVLNWNKATITGGTFECTAANCVLNGAFSSSTSTNDQGSLTITGGSFTSTGTPIVNNFTTSEYIEVTGGTFSGEFPAEFCPEGNKPVLDENGKYVIGIDNESAVAEVNGVGYPSVQDAIDAIDSEGTVTLLNNFEGTFTVPEGKKITLDLNDKILTNSTESNPGVLGELTIKDSQGSGKLISDKLIVVQGAAAKFTLESGTLEVTNDYGVYCRDGATAIINGGEINSKYAALSGNNTTGDMNFEVHGGTLTTTEGPAIYMPGQVSLTITDGVINGGISLRMGQVNISGGKIIATNGEISDLTVDYTYSGNVAFPDALFILAGTYTSDSEKGNSLTLNITGGEFICENGQGSAIAIYDLAKVEQPANVEISGTAVLTTNAEDRLAYQVLTLADIGVETPADGYGNADLVGKVDTAISGGTFSTEVPEEYWAEGCEPTVDDEGNFVFKTIVNILFKDGADGNEFTGLSTTVLAGEKITAPDGTIKPGYKIKGWYTDAALTEKWDFENDVVPSGVTEFVLYGKFEKDTTSFTYPCSTKGNITLASGIEMPDGYTYEFVWTDADGSIVGRDAELILKAPSAGSAAAYVLTVTSTDPEGNSEDYTIVYTVSVEAHTGGKATCCDQARCSVCRERYGDLDPENHAYSAEIRNAVAATIESEGYTGDRYCKGCGMLIRRGTVIPKLDHEHTLVKTDAKEATCTEDGNVEYYTCSTCGKIYLNADGSAEVTIDETVIPATGHSFGTEYQSDETEHWHECTACGEKADVAEHTFGEWTVTKEATATEDGSRERTCSVCGHVETEVIPATGEETTAPAETTTSGKDDDTKSNTGTIILWIVIAVVVVAVVVIVIVYMKKKNGGTPNGGTPNSGTPNGGNKPASSASGTGSQKTGAQNNAGAQTNNGSTGKPNA